MTDGKDWIAHDVTLTEAPDGSLLIDNPTPLGDCPPNIGLWLRRHAAERPDHRFIAERQGDGWRAITYAEAARAVDRLSNGLIAAKLADRPIAILSHNSVEMALVQLAAMQIGVPVVPISQAYSTRSATGERVHHILDVTEAAALVMSDAALHRPKLGDRDLRLFAVRPSLAHPDVAPLSALDDADGGLSREAGARFDAVGLDTLAKIQFTSGSTALPKGVEVTQRMLISNQVGVAQMWPWLGSDLVVIDWLPWNHTFGGNFVFDMVLMHGGTLYIDDGNPSPQGFEALVQNVREVAPTLYFGVPRSYSMLLDRMRRDPALRRSLFRRLRALFTASAALDEATWRGLREMIAAERGDARAVPFLAGWGSTETAPDSTLIYWHADDTRVIGLPIPGVTIKLAPPVAGRRELRVRGPNVTPGYHRDPAATAAAFDDEGFFCTGDAGGWLDPDEPARGLVFAGRMTEDFKLSTGVWVHNASLRASVNALGQPHLLDVVVAAPDRDHLAALVFPDVGALRTRFADAAARHPDDAAFLHSGEVSGFFAEVFRAHNRAQRGSSTRFVRFALLTTPPRIDAGETTDKGYINQRAVLTHRAAVVEALYAEPPGPGVVVV